jgi:hypothetical protein
MKAPLLICKGLAKKFKLRCSGMRNWLGQTLFLRNDEWLNGTMPGLCIAFAGSNTDVKSNDSLPITAVTHERCCRKSCVRKSTLGKTTRVTQRTQSVTNGYFGGYVGKRQPTGSLETRKCVDKQFTLRAKIVGSSKGSQLRAATGRMITDMEMNSTYRGAVEVFNLCRNLRSNDVLFAECIRTFSSCTLNGQLWMYRLDALQQCKAMQSFQVETFLPPTKRPNVRTDRSSPNAMDMYGFRPFRHPWKLLSAYEFTQAWRGEPLMIPSYYTNKGSPERSAWTEAGIQLSRTKE